MASQKGGRSSGEGGGNSKFRLIVLDADLASGDLSQIASAITNALRPAHVPQQSTRLLNAPTPPAGPVLNGSPSASADDATDVEVEQPIETESDGGPVTATPKKDRKRYYREPKILDKLDLVGTTGTTWVDFATQKAPKNRTKRFL